jgi:hypothetical protein
LFWRVGIPAATLLIGGGCTLVRFAEVARRDPVRLPPGNVEVPDARSARWKDVSTLKQRLVDAFAGRKLPPWTQMVFL